MCKEYNFVVDADFNQFLILDEVAEEPKPNSFWTEESFAKMLALSPGVIGVGTGRRTSVPVKVVVRDSRPEPSFSSFDRVNECSIDIVSGKLLIMGCTSFIGDAVKIDLEPGVYHTIIKYGDLETVDETQETGTDFYEVELWPEKSP
jgi:hypothetical protein